MKTEARLWESHLELPIGLDKIFLDERIQQVAENNPELIMVLADHGNSLVDEFVAHNPDTRITQVDFSCSLSRDLGSSGDVRVLQALLLTGDVPQVLISAAVCPSAITRPQAEINEEAYIHLINLEYDGNSCERFSKTYSGESAKALKELYDAFMVPDPFERQSYGYFKRLVRTLVA